MARTLIRGETQIMPESITNAEIDLAAGIELTKIEKGTSIVLSDGTPVTGDINLAGFKVTGASIGVLDSDYVTKSQLDSVSAGLDAKESCHVASTGNIDLVTGGLLTIDLEVLVTGQRVLVKDQTDPIENGIYEASSGSWIRTLDFDGTPSNEVQGGSYTFISNGNDNGGTGWIVVAEGDIVVDTDPIVWTQFSGAASYTGGNGININGTVITADVDDTTLVNTGGGGTQIGIKPLGVTNTELGLLSVSTANLQDTSVTAVKINVDVAGDGLVKNGVTNALDVNVDNSTIEINADSLRVVSGGIDTLQLADDSVTAAKINADVAGLALVQSVSGSLDVNITGTTLSITSDALHVSSNGITEVELSSTAFGDGLVGGSGTVVSVEAFNGILVDTNGVSVLPDGTTITVSASGVKVSDSGIDTLQLADDSVTAAKINVDVAGDGLVQNVGTGALDVNVDGTTLSIIADTVGVSASGITEVEISSTALGSGLIGGSGTVISVDPNAILLLANYIVRENLSGQVDGVTAVFTLANTPVVGTDQIFVNGVLMDEGASNDYTILGNTITFTFVPKYHPTKPDKRDKILVTYISQ